MSREFNFSLVYCTLKPKSSDYFSNPDQTFLLSVCPLVFPDMKHVAKSCANSISNQTACCSAMESYVSHLQKQSFVTNLQAVDCATSMGAKLRKLNISTNVYSLCRITLKDFSVQG